MIQLATKKAKELRKYVKGWKHGTY
jgi:hypothetical protein